MRGYHAVVPEARLLLAWARPLGGGVLDGIDIDKFGFSESPGQNTVVLRAVLPNGGSVEYEFDSGRGHVATRYSVYGGAGASILRESAQYRQDSAGLWLPTGWEMISLNTNDSVRESIVSRVDEFSVNCPTSGDEFDMQPEPGSFFRDAVANEFFVVSDSGHTKLLRPDQLSLSYEELTVQSRGVPVLWLTVAICAIAVATAVMISRVIRRGR